MNSKTVLIPNALINSGSTSMATGASYISCDYSFTAMGDGVNGVMLMYDNDLTGSSTSSSSSAEEP